MLLVVQGIVLPWTSISGFVFPLRVGNEMSEHQGRRLGFVTASALAVVIAVWGAAVAAIAYSVSTGSFQSLWNGVNAGQAQILSSAIAALGLLTSAILVPFIFKDRIRDLDGAVSEMRGTITGFEEDARNRLNALTTLLDERMADIERRSGEDADRIGEVLDEIRSAVILSISGGQISDPKHAKVFVQNLYNDAVAALHRRVREKPYLREVTRTQISELRTMSSQYLSKLLEVQIITDAERALVDRIKEYAYRRNGFGVADINEINRTREAFDKAFGENAIANADVK